MFLDEADQQHSSPATALAPVTRAVPNHFGEGLSCTGTSGAACPCDDPNGSDETKDDNDDDTWFSEIIRDCDKVIEGFVADKLTFTDWRRVLVYNKEWNNIRPHFFRHCQDRVDSEVDPMMKNKLLWLGKKLKEVCIS